MVTDIFPPRNFTEGALSTVDRVQYVVILITLRSQSAHQPGKWTWKWIGRETGSTTYLTRAIWNPNSLLSDLTPVRDYSSMTPFNYLEYSS